MSRNKNFFLIYLKEAERRLKKRSGSVLAFWNAFSEALFSLNVNCTYFGTVYIQRSEAITFR